MPHALGGVDHSDWMTGRIRKGKRSRLAVDGDPCARNGRVHHDIVEGESGVGEDVVAGDIAAIRGVADDQPPDSHAGEGDRGPGKSVPLRFDRPDLAAGDGPVECMDQDCLDGHVPVVVGVAVGTVIDVVAAVGVSAEPVDDVLMMVVLPDEESRPKCCGGRRCSQTATCLAVRDVVRAI